MLFSAAGLVAIFRAPFTWRFRLMFGTFEALAIYFGWLLIRVSKLIAWPDEAADNGRDFSFLFRDPLVRRAIWVLLAAGGLMIATIILEVTGLLG
jgi:hypothetical protein